MVRFGVAVALFLFVAPGSIAAADGIDSLLDDARARGLGGHAEWHRLLHYHSLKSRPGVVASHVADDRYFLAEAGRQDGDAELAATIGALFSGSPVVDDTHPRCRFVEREKWLRTQLQLPPAAVPAACNDYHHWRTTIDAHSIKLIFPAAYLNNPSSMFGHTLLRFDPEDIDENSPWLSWSLNFAAEVGEDAEQSMGYAIKGITGAYPGRFQVVPYFQKLQEYGAIENRDIWEYSLDLDQDEVGRLVDHTWELHDINFDYYFFRENCSFRLLELLDYARPKLNLADGFTWTAIPADTVKAVVGAGLVNATRYRASLGTELQYRADRIPSAQRHWIESLEQDPADADTQAFRAVDPELQRDIVLAANQLMTYRTRKSGTSKVAATRRFRMLQLVNRYSGKGAEAPVEAVSRETPPTVIATDGSAPDGSATDGMAPDGSDAPPVPSRPEKGHDTVLVSLAGGEHGRSTYSELSLRLSYHDLLDNPTGYLRGAGIELGGLSIRRDADGDARLNGFDILRLRSVGTRSSLFRSVSWGVDVGFVRDRFLENDALSFRLGALVGRSWSHGDLVQSYALIGPSANVFRSGNHDGYLNAQARGGLLGYTRAGTTQLALEFDSVQRAALRSGMFVRHNLPLARNHALRLSLGHVQQGKGSERRGELAYRFSF